MVNVHCTYAKGDMHRSPHLGWKTSYMDEYQISNYCVVPNII